MLNFPLQTRDPESSLRRLRSYDNNIQVTFCSVNQPVSRTSINPTRLAALQASSSLAACAANDPPIASHSDPFTVRSSAAGFDQLLFDPQGREGLARRFLRGRGEGRAGRYPARPSFMTPCQRSPGLPILVPRPTLGYKVVKGFAS